MKLFEHEGKDLLRKHGVPTPNGKVATTIAEAVEAAGKYKTPFAIKAQILAGGRGKAGGILSGSNSEDAKKAATKLLRSQIKGSTVNKVLIEEKVKVARELFFAVAIDRIERSYVTLASSKGGIDVELAAAESPSSVVKAFLHPMYGLRSPNSKKIAEKLGYGGKQQADLAAILERLCQIAMDNDAVLSEINPLAETIEGSFIALDCRFIIDDNAIFRHPEFAKLRFESNRENTEQEIEAMKEDLAYVKLDGDVGIIGNGAGLVMATLDMVQEYGGRPANFLDLGGGAQADRIAAALELVLSDPIVKVILVNVLGGLTRCDDLARAIVTARGDRELTKPIVVRLVGTNENEGKAILAQAGLQTLESMEEAAKQAVEMAKNRSR